MDQAWKTCKGTLYEYAIFKYIQNVVSSDEKLKKFKVLMGEDARDQHTEQIVIRNWSEIFPDVDILIVEDESVRAIISCKTSMRERLTETAFWKRELERRGRNIKLLFITTDKDNELRIDTNRYILLHVIDCTFVTDPEKYKSLVKSYEEKYGDRADFESLISKVRPVDDLGVLLKTLINYMP